MLGRWEGNLIKGIGNRSSVGTLGERTSQRVISVKLVDAKAETARDEVFAGLLDKAANTIASENAQGVR